MGRKEPGPYNPGKTWPGEAHKQPQLATQYYPCAVDEESLRIRNKVHRSLISIFSLKNTEFFADFSENYTVFARILLDFG